MSLIQKIGITALTLSLALPVVGSAQEKKEEKNPLIQLSMLKLGVTYQKENKYQKSLKVNLLF